MTFVSVRILIPDGRVFRVEIDDEADVEEVKKSLVESIPSLDPLKKYQLQLLDAMTIAAGATLRLEEMEPPKPIRKLQVEPDEE